MNVFEILRLDGISVSALAYATARLGALARLLLRRRLHIVSGTALVATREAAAYA